ncbi:MAG: hypothetical protein IKN74_00890 [Clostridia bacterium]|nr:hypothetical protein [Bacilli bacterium]MBR3511498.1 hypothetical protein [Clostridia bacterium]
MKNSYDYTKDEKYKSYEQFVYKSLIDLGFRITNVGTMYLKDLILFAYFNNYYEINVTKIVKDFMQYKNINYISYRTFINCIVYSINSITYDSFKKIFKIHYNEYYNSTKNLIILFINMLNYYKN